VGVAEQDPSRARPVQATTVGHGHAGDIAEPWRIAEETRSGQATSDQAGMLTEAVAVTAFWRALGLPGLIDVHTHFMPSNVLVKVWAFFEADRGGSGPAWPITYRLAELERLALLRAFGVRRFSALLYPHRPGMAAWLNEWAADFAARTPDALHSATFYPEESASRYVSHAIEAGARLFKAHVQVGGYDPRDELLDPVWGMLAEARVPAVVHCGSGPTSGEFTGPGPISAVLARHPRLVMIVAHMGAPEYAEFLDLADAYQDVHLDTTMAFTDFMNRIAPFPAALRARLAGVSDRILLGSDFPNIPYPYLRQLEALARLGLGDDWLRGVCYGNAARLLGSLGERSRDRREPQHVGWTVQVGQRDEDSAHTALGEQPVPADVIARGARAVLARVHGGGQPAPELLDQVGDVFAVVAEHRNIEHGEQHLGRIAARLLAVRAQYRQLAVQRAEVGREVAAVGKSRRDPQRTPLA
jgi:uncharacterized protein